MNRLIILLCLFILVVNSCKQNENMIHYNPENSYIYFAYPDATRGDAERFADSVYYGFASDPDLQRREKTIGIPIRVSGTSQPNDRLYSLVIEDSSRYEVGAIGFSTTIIPANQYDATLNISVQRTAKMESEPTVLYLRLEANNEFALGNVHNQRITLIVDDILNEPVWWNAWRVYFGPYHKEIFQQWMQIYYLGADPSPELITGAPGPIYYWNQMPTTANPTWYPVTFNYIRVLKQYFIDNEVYPNGDISKGRILLP